MATSDLLNKLRTDITDTYTSINNLGGTIPEHKNTENISPAIESIYNKLPKVSDTGTDLSLSPTLEARLGFIPRGNTSQDGTPTPTSPIMPEVVAGENSVKVENRNLFDINVIPSTLTVTGTSEEFKLERNGATYVNILENFKENTRYIFKGSYSSTYLDGALTIVYTDNTTYNLVAIWGGGSLNKTNFEYTTPAGKTIKTLRTQLYSGSNLTLYNFQIERGTTATDYVEHKEQNYQLSLGDIELVEIGDYADYIEGMPDNWYIPNKIQKINSYNGELIVTDYISSTGGLDTGATIYYLSNETLNITDTSLINQLNALYYARSYDGETNISTSCEEGNMPIKINASALKGNN